MTNPKEQLPTYLNNLGKQIHRVTAKLETYLYLRSCENNERFDVLQATTSFWETVFDALETDIIVSLHNFFDPSSPLYICKALANLKTQHTSTFNEGKNSGIEVSLKEFFNKNQKVIDAASTKIEALVHHRNKYRAHLDKKYFNNPSQLVEDAPLLMSDLQELLEILQNIIKEYKAKFMDTDLIFDSPSQDGAKRLFNALLNYHHLITESAKNPKIFEWFQENQQTHLD